jgi:hypothetical protein
MDDQPKTNRAGAEARALAADLEYTVPTSLDGDDGWRAVAERDLATADAAGG